VVEVMVQVPIRECILASGPQRKPTKWKLIGPAVSDKSSNYRV